MRTGRPALPFSHTRPCPMCKSVQIGKRRDYCADCNRKKSAESRRLHPEWFKRFRQTEKHREYVARLNKVRRADPVARAKNRARNLIAMRIHRGKMVRAPCESCGTLKAHAHHNDYTKALQIKWLCRSCHLTEHHGDWRRLPDAS